MNTVAILRTGKLFLIEVMKNEFIKVISFGIELEFCAVFQKLVMGFWGAHSGGGSCHDQSYGELKAHGIFMEWLVERIKKGRKEEGDEIEMVLWRILISC